MRAIFSFVASLNDFLPDDKKYENVIYQFSRSPSIKDAIEAIGIVHPEVGYIEVNNIAASYYDLVRDNDEITVYPLVPDELLAYKFILDVHLGKLAHYPKFRSRSLLRGSTTLNLSGFYPIF